MSAAIHPHFQHAKQGPLRALLHCDLPLRRPVTLRGPVTLRSGDLVPSSRKTARAGLAPQPIGRFARHADAPRRRRDRSRLRQSPQKRGLTFRRPAITASTKGHGGESGNPDMPSLAARRCGLHPRSLGTLLRCRKGDPLSARACRVSRDPVGARQSHRFVHPVRDERNARERPLRLRRLLGGSSRTSKNCLRLECPGEQTSQPTLDPSVGERLPFCPT